MAMLKRKSEGDYWRCGSCGQEIDINSGCDVVFEQEFGYEGPWQEFSFVYQTPQTLALSACCRDQVINEYGNILPGDEEVW